MADRMLHGEWERLRALMLHVWPLLSASDVAAIDGQREELMRRLKARYAKSYGEIEREVHEFEVRDVRAAYASRPSLGISQD